MSRRRRGRSGSMDPGFTSQLDAAWNIALTFLILAAILSAIAQKATITAEAAMEGADDRVKPIQVVIQDGPGSQIAELQLRDPGENNAPKSGQAVSTWMASLCEQNKLSEGDPIPVLVAFGNEDLTHKQARLLALSMQRDIGTGCRTIY